MKLESDVYVFLTDFDKTKHVATVEVFKKAGRTSTPESKVYKVKVGDRIGKLETVKGRNKVDFSTGLAVVDIDDEYIFYPPDGGPQVPTVAMILSETGDSETPGALREIRMKAKDDQVYRDLKEPPGKSDNKPPRRG